MNTPTAQLLAIVATRGDAAVETATTTSSEIGFVAGARIYGRMAWLRMRRGRVVWLAAAMFALPIAYVAGLAIAGHWGRGLFDDVCELYFRFLIPFIPALTASAAVAEEIENKTFTFVFARPAAHFGTGRNAGVLKASPRMLSWM